MIHSPTSRGLRRVAAATVVAGLVAGALLGRTDAHWSRFRGPNGSGVADADSLPSILSEETLTWEAQIPPGSSSPAIWGDRLFLTGLDEAGQEAGRLVTFAVRTSDGALLWSRAAPRPRLETLDPRNHPAAASPVTDGERVVVFFGDYGHIAYDLDGRELWRRALGPFNNVYGMGASPILTQGLVIQAIDQQTGSFLLALDAEDGSEVWRRARPEAKSGHATPVLYRPPGGDPQLLLPGSFLLTAYDPRTGDKLWWVGGLSFEIKSTAVLSDEHVFIHGYGSPLNEAGTLTERRPFEEVLATADANGDGVLQKDESPDDLTREWFGFMDLNGDQRLDREDWSYFRAALSSRNSMLAIRLPSADARGDLSDTAVAWRHVRNVPQLPSPLLYRGVLYMINDRGIVTTFRPATGEVIVRGRIEGAVDSFYASPVAGDGKVYFASRSGTVAVVPAGGQLETLSVNDLDGQIDATPALESGRIYVRAGDRLLAFSAGARKAAQ